MISVKQKLVTSICVGFLILIIADKYIYSTIDAFPEKLKEYFNQDIWITSISITEILVLWGIYEGGKYAYAVFNKARG